MKPDAPREDPWSTAKALARATPECCEFFESPPVRTVLTPAYRLAVLDLNDPRIAAGHAASLRALSELKALLEISGASLLVVLIPTKETVFADPAEEASPVRKRLIAMEARVWRDTKKSLNREGIAFADALPELRKALAEGRSPYPEGTDGHPNADGHAAIAAAASTAVKAGRHPSPEP